MTSINTNVAAMAAVRSLSNISTDMGRTQQRIETGLRVGAANHDPAVFSISQRMRADISSMEAVRDGLSFGRATLGVARDAATSISNELNSLRKTVMQGLQDGIDAATINRQIQDSVTNIDTYARSATFNGVNLLVQAGDAALGVNDYDLRMPTDVNGRRLEVNTNPAGALRSTATALGVQGLEVANNAVRFTLPDAFNLDGSATAANVTTLTLQRSERINGANVNVDYVFEFKTAGTALQTTPDLDATGGMTKVFAVDLQAGETPLANIGRLLDTVRSQGFGATLENDGRILISSGGLSANVADHSFANVNQGGGTANAAVAMVNANNNGVLSTIDTAITNMGTRLSGIGAALRQVEGLQNFNRQLMDSVKEGLGALVDADLAEESARLTSLQTRQQLATQSLSIANQQGQSLLSLFR
ncbi:MAG TPA: flagellin [Acetobacteraceae bacterium]|nr:flagellin [Acetobacteraceae bacterium]